MDITFLEEIKIRGMKDKKEEINKLNHKDIKFIKSLEHCKLCKENYPVHLMNLEDAFYDTKYFMESLFDLHDVPSTTANLNSDNFNVINIYPLDLPIFKNKESSSVFSGNVYEILQLNRKPSILFRGITITDEIYETTSAVYSHEITHTQLDSIQGSIEYYKHMEVISMLIEAIHTLELGEDERLLRLYDCYRICEMLNGLEGLLDESCDIKDKLSMSQYLVSNLKAYNVFMLFYYGNDQMKQEIISWIQDIFNGEITVEEFLNHFDSLEDFSYETKKLKKYFSRKSIGYNNQL